MGNGINQGCPRKFSNRWISCGCFWTFALLLLLWGVAGVAHAERTFGFEELDSLIPWRVEGLEHAKNVRTHFVKGVGDGRGVVLKFTSTDHPARDPSAHLRYDFDEARDFSQAMVRIRGRRMKRSTVFGVALYDGNKLVAEYTRQLRSRDKWASLVVDLPKTETARTGEGRLSHVDAIALLQRNPGSVSESDGGQHVFRYDEVSIRGVPGLTPTTQSGEAEGGGESAARSSSGQSELPQPRRGHENVPELLRDDKLMHEEGFRYRVMVEKPYTSSGKSVEWHVNKGVFKRYAKLGFNTFCSRWFNDAKKEKIVSAAERVGELGMYYLHWDRGSFNVGEVPGRPPRFVHRDGTRHERAISPSSQAFWQALEEIVMRTVRASTEAPVMGMFLDFEKYHQRGMFTGHWFPLSYDDHAWSMFFHNRGNGVREMAYAKRAHWLEHKGLLQAYRQFQIKYWKRKASALREKIDAINPRFRFALYPASYTLFVRTVLFGPFSTEQAPVIAAEHYTYGRGSPLKDHYGKRRYQFPDDQALGLDRAFMRRQEQKYQRWNVPHANLGGIFPAHNQGDAQLVARKIHQFSTHHDGYWIFYQGVKPGTPRERAYEYWFKIANRAITEERDSVLTEPPEDHKLTKWLRRLDPAVPAD